LIFSDAHARWTLRPKAKRNTIAWALPDNVQTRSARPKSNVSSCCASTL